MLLGMQQGRRSWSQKPTRVSGRTPSNDRDRTDHDFLPHLDSTNLGSGQESIVTRGYLRESANYDEACYHRVDLCRRRILLASQTRRKEHEECEEGRSIDHLSGVLMSFYRNPS